VPKALVFGKNGQVARSLSETVPQEIEAIFVGSDACDFAGEPDFEAILEKVRPDLVINAAAYTAVEKAETEVELSLKINAGAPERLGVACRSTNIPLIHFSTDYVFDGDLGRPYREEDDVAPSGQYGHSKYEGERALLNSGAAVVIFRTSWVFSPFGNNFLKTMLRLGKEKPEVRVVHDQYGFPTSALEIARTVWTCAPKILEQPAASRLAIYHLAGKDTKLECPSWFDFADNIFEQAEGLGLLHKVSRFPIPSSEFPSSFRRPADSRLDTTKLRDDFGLVLPDWRQSVSEVLKRLAASA